MPKHILLLLAPILFLLNGCVERGYRLSTTPSTHTVTAQMSSNIDTTHSTKDDLKKMKTAVKKELNKQIRHKKKKTHTIKRETKAPKVEKVVKTDSAPTPIGNMEDRELEMHAAALERELALKNKRKASKIANEKQTAMLALQKEQEEAEAKRLQEIEYEKTAQEAIAEKMKKIKAQREEEALALKLHEEKLAQEKKLRETQARKEKERQKEKSEAKVVPIAKGKTTFTQPLRFTRVNKIYQKFGTSEIHGHVIYLDETGQEVHLRQTKVYLLPISAKINNWYNTYYLKNRTKGSSSTKVSFLNDTTLDLNRNFEFFGVAAGNYYIIIEAQYPGSSKKVYIAKKIQVGKYKKVMAVFSKKL